MKLPEKQLKETRAYLRDFLQTDPFRLYGVHAVGVGRKEKNGKVTDKVALRVYTARKIPDSELPVERRLPAQFTWMKLGSKKLVTIITDVIESPPALVQIPDPESRIRPVPGGVSGSAQGSGTLGGWVWDTLDESIVMLSNAHVLGYVAGVPILQPAATDGGQLATDRIGTVKRSVNVTPVMGPRPWPMEQCNFVDAAIGAADSSDLMDLTVLEIGPAIYSIKDAEIDMPIEKSGQTTGHVVGVIVDVDYAAAYNTPTGSGNWQIVGYCDLIRFEPSSSGEAMALPGDSGSVVFTPDQGSVINPAVGLLAWGADDGSYGVAAKIQNVFTELRVDVLCAGGYEAFLDALAEDTNDYEAAFANALFEPGRPRPGRTLRLRNGLARDVQKELRRSETGSHIVKFVNTHRAEVLMMLLKRGDFRRSMVQALRPILKGLTTTSQVFSHVVSDQDVKRAELAFDEAVKYSSKTLVKDIKTLRIKLMLKDRVNETVRQLIGDYRS